MVYLYTKRALYIYTYVNVLCINNNKNNNNQTYILFSKTIYIFFNLKRRNMHTNTGVHIRTHNSLLNSIGHKTATPLCLKLPSIAASFTFTPLSHPAHTCSHPVTHTQVCPTVLRNAARHEAVAAHGKRDGWW